MSTHSEFFPLITSPAPLVESMHERASFWLPFVNRTFPGARLAELQAGATARAAFFLPGRRSLVMRTLVRWARAADVHADLKFSIRAGDLYASLGLPYKGVHAMRILSTGTKPSDNSFFNSILILY